MKESAYRRKSFVNGQYYPYCLRCVDNLDHLKLQSVITNWKYNGEIGNRYPFRTRIIETPKNIILNFEI